MLRVAAFTGGRDVPGARFRVRQYIPALNAMGVQVHESVARFGAYPPGRRWLRPLWATASLGSRVPGVLGSYRHDMTLLQREMISTFLTLEPLTKAPRVLDVDDAIWVYRGGNVARRLARISQSVICGNGFLAEQFSRWNPSVTIIPTAVDTLRYCPGAAPSEYSNAVIGWIGTSGNFGYLYQIEAALAAVLKARQDAVLRIISDSRPGFSAIRQDRVEFLRWSPESEVAAIQGISVGIMPLDDSAWTRGKCSLKMLQYLACGVPVVVSPVGMNQEVLSKGSVGIGARTRQDWIEALLALLSSAGERASMGQAGRRIVEQHFSTETIAGRLASTLQDVAA